MSKFKIDFKMALDVACFLGASLSVFYLLNTYLNDITSPITKDKKKLKESMNKFKQANPDFDASTLSEYERSLLSAVITSQEIKVTFQDIGGLELIVDDLKESVLLPLTCPELYTQYADLLQAPKGVLLYGPPGCGKTMLAKLLAAESGANFISIRMSTILDKWVGESNKLVDAIFSLLNKLQPCIVFIDEIDSFLRDRTSQDHEVTAMLKAEFMQLWDGLKANGRIMVLGATNRPDDIDSAFMRRLPKRFHIDLPGLGQRVKILDLMLKDVRLEEGFTTNEIAEHTQGYSGSDLSELARSAAFSATREFIRENVKDVTNIDNQKINLRPLRFKDFFPDKPRISNTIV